MLHTGKKLRCPTLADASGKGGLTDRKDGLTGHKNDVADRKDGLVSGKNGLTGG